MKTLTESTFVDGTLSLTFTDKSETEIIAGQPYIIKWTEPYPYNKYNGTNADECDDIVNPVFNGVTIVNTNTTTETSDYVDFIGIYKPKSIYESGQAKHNLYIGNGNTLYYPNDSGFKLNAFRSYFQLKGLSTGGQTTNSPNNQTAVRAFTMDFGDGSEETGIIDAETNSHPSPLTIHTGIPLTGASSVGASSTV